MSSTLTVPVPRSGAGANEYTVSISREPDEIRAAQRLRYQVFHGDLGAALPASAGEAGRADGEVDSDEFDEHCDHVIVRRQDSGAVVGTYRLLPPGRTERLYSDQEFDLDALREIRGHLVEAGRSCVHPHDRGGAVIHLMWSAVGHYMLRTGHEYLAGCASVPLADNGHAAAQTWQLAQAKHWAPDGFRVSPHQPWPPHGEQGKASYAAIPPLLRGYLRLGAWVCGPPAHDPDFGVADFFTLLPMSRADQRYLRHFLGEQR